MADNDSIRRPLSVRTRFEIFKRDNFTCRYCGQTSPDVVLEVDHVVPVCEGGTDDPMNLVTACWACNSGKSGVSLSQVMTGEDPHDSAVIALERERQLREYNAVMQAAREQRERDAWELIRHWTNDPETDTFDRREFSWLVSTLGRMPKEKLREYMDAAIRVGITNNLRYVKGCVRSDRERFE